ncbi:MAG: glycosyltransferase family 4 protein [Actinobacteria bacterium]|nr:glycosyltransferase family 4 protein [Actinomycetota bacterium]
MSGPTVVWVLVGDLGRTGVPVALARMARWHAHTRTDAGATPVQLHVLAGRDGPLRADLAAATASVTVLEPAHRRSAATTVAAAAAQSGRPGAADRVRALAWRTRTRRLPAPDVVLVHGAGAWRIHADLADRLPPGHRLVVHLHELDEALARCIPADRRADFLGTADAVLAVCTPVADLAVAAGARPASVSVATVAADDAPVAAAGPASPRRPAVVSIGAPGWRKGTDRALAVAHELRRTHPEVRCSWVGGEPAPAERFAVGSSLPLAFHPSTSTPWQAAGPGTVLLVPSREDPFPLVVLEAGARGLPVVAAATGGLPELLGHGRGWVVPGHDLVALAEAVAEALDAPDDAAARGEALRFEVAARHAPAVVGPAWLAAVLGPLA